MATPFYPLVLGILAVWRLTHLLHAEDGPGNVLASLRRAAGQGFWASLLDCFYCLSLWLALPLALLLGQGLAGRLLLWPALSAGAILLERLTRKGEPLPAVFYSEDEENDHVLRQEQDATADGIPGTDPVAGR
ncbi:hypothetical protein [Aliidongia dinghuensis]|nr:hypothetical protein [Aliidongia dinghuensis]